jgi:hypothetical protein
VTVSYRRGTTSLARRSQAASGMKLSGSFSTALAMAASVCAFTRFNLVLSIAFVVRPLFRRVGERGDAGGVDFLLMLSCLSSRFVSRRSPDPHLDTKPGCTCHVYQRIEAKEVDLAPHEIRHARRRDPRRRHAGF